MDRPSVKAGWTRATFGELVRKVADRIDPQESRLERYVAGEHMDSDDLHIRRWGIVGDGYLGPAFHMRFKAGHVLYGSRRTYLRKVAVPHFEGITANTTFVLEPKDSTALLPELLPFIMQTESFHEHSIKQSKGSVNPYVNFSDLAWYEFALPPLQEQRRIAEALRAVEAVKEHLLQAVEGSDTAVQSFLRGQVAGMGNLRRFGDFVVKTEYGSSERANSDREGLPILRIPNVLRGELDLSEVKWITASSSQVEKYTVKPGDILMVRTNGNPEYVGRCLVVPELDETTLFASYLIRIEVDRSMMSPQFATILLNSRAIRRLLRGAIRSSAGNYNINTRGIRSASIPCPALDAQDRLVERIAALRDAQEDLTQKGASIEPLEKSILEHLER